MDEQKLSFDDFRIPHLKKVLPALAKLFKSLDIQFYILGGLARDIHFSVLEIEAVRMTKDLDIAIFVPESDQFDLVINELVKQYGYQKVEENPVVLIHPSGLNVDFIPFNKLSSVDGSMAEFGADFEGFNLKGFYEISLASIEAIEIEGVFYNVSTPEAIILLKILAFDDRPDWRGKDLEDIGQLLKYYFDLNTDQIYEDHNDLFDDDPAQKLEEISARVIGRKMAATLKTNDELKKDILSIIGRYLSDENHAAVIQLSIELEMETDVVKKIIRQLKTGLE